VADKKIIKSLVQVLQLPVARFLLLKVLGFELRAWSLYQLSHNPSPFCFIFRRECHTSCLGPASDCHLRTFACHRAGITDVYYHTWHPSLSKLRTSEFSSSKYLKDHQGILTKSLKHSTRIFSSQRQTGVLRQ
jgi:hypothetical protein